MNTASTTTAADTHTIIILHENVALHSLYTNVAYQTDEYVL